MTRKRKSPGEVDGVLPPPGHGTEALGPSDTSDSGSDIAGAPGLADDDEDMLTNPGTTSDLDLGQGAGLDLGDADLDSDSDASGTGERRGAGRDDSSREANDILPDKITRDPGGLTDKPEARPPKPGRRES